MRQVLLTPGELSGWVAEVPSLPGCVSVGETRDEALSNVREAIELYEAALQAKGVTPPPETYEAHLLVV